MNSNRKIIFVTPWYGKFATGGAETLCKTVVEHLHHSGHEVEIYTTCSKQFLSSWENDFKPGKYIENGLTVRRFQVDSRNRDVFNFINQKILSATPISEEEEYLFFKNNINSTEMMKAIRQDSDGLFAFIPYLYGTTFFGCLIHPERSVMIPCLHDEGYSKMKLMKDAISKVHALVFNSDAERDLAKSLIGKLPTYQVIGVGIDQQSESPPQNFKKKYNLDKFILCASRKDNGKNTPLLVDYFCKFLERNNTDLKLVLTGKGYVNIPQQYSKNILDLFLTKDELYDAYSTATIFCLPSVNESFSIVIMESWLNNVPVLVNGNCEVTKEHCIKSNGGLFFENYEEFEECIKFLLENEDIRDKLGENGQRYVKNNFNWDKITSAYKEFFKSLNS